MENLDRKESCHMRFTTICSLKAENICWFYLRRSNWHCLQPHAIQATVAPTQSFDQKRRHRQNVLTPRTTPYQVMHIQCSCKVLEAQRPPNSNANNFGRRGWKRTTHKLQSHLWLGRQNTPSKILPDCREIHDHNAVIFYAQHRQKHWAIKKILYQVIPETRVIVWFARQHGQASLKLP